MQFYVEATDSTGLASTFPAAGEDSRALYQVDDGRGPNSEIDSFRLVMLRDDYRVLEPTQTRQEREKHDQSLSAGDPDSQRHRLLRCSD